MTIQSLKTNHLDGPRRELGELGGESMHISWSDNQSRTLADVGRMGCILLLSKSDYVKFKNAISTTLLQNTFGAV